jgi:photosystem II stability/assembly factor-like uncharacterized protein
VRGSGKSFTDEKGSLMVTTTTTLSGAVWYSADGGRNWYASAQSAVLSLYDPPKFTPAEGSAA